MANAGPMCPARPPRRRPASSPYLSTGCVSMSRTVLQDRLAGAGFDVASNDEPRGTADGYRDRQAGARPGTGRFARTRSGSPSSQRRRRGRRHRSRSCGRSWQRTACKWLAPTETGDPGRDCVDRSRRDRPPRPRRRRAAGRVTSTTSWTASSAASVSCSTRAGQRVDVVTDHGWMLLPGRHGEGRASGGDDRAQEGALRPAQGRRRSRRSPPCPGSGIQDVRIALAPGATCFEANKEYEHGGVSPQECIVPRLVGACWQRTQPASAARRSRRSSGSGCCAGWSSAE